ncbi:MAG TPA: 8-amino-7-oxononanoate synthase [Nitrospira sp.]|nr:8-amino-7-oxononanoate synthase [Nitrospira sp.]
MFDKLLADIEANHLTRRMPNVDSAVGPVVEIDGRRVLLLASNDYLGLAAHPNVIQAAAQALHHYGAGAGAARLISGSLPPHRQLESELARFKGTEAALAFGSGYLANIGVIPALIGRGGLILADRLCHASLIDGCRLSGADFRVYRHKDVEQLRSLLDRRARKRPTFIVTDGVFSMDGDLAPLPDLADLAARYGAQLYVDDAHGTGVMGETGRGTIEHFHLEGSIPFHMGTLSKALGSSGGYLAGPDSLIQYLINTSRSFMFTTAPTPSSAAAAAAGVRILEQEPERRRRLWDNRERLHAGLTSLGFSLAPSQSPILPLIVGDADRTLTFARELLERGVFAPAIRPPTVPDSTSRIRVTVTSEHTPEQIEEALAVFRCAGEAARVL